MARVIVLDSGPLGLACGTRGKPRVEAMTQWRIMARSNGILIVIPEIADYEVRRELIRARAAASIERLDRLRDELDYLPISTAAMKTAAELWARSREHGLPTADDRALDGDAILAAQALCFVGLRDRLTVATDNVRHIARFRIDALLWEDITP